MRTIKALMAAGVFAVAVAATPANAAYHFCTALNIKDGAKDALVSPIFQREDGEYVVGIENDWVSFLNNNEWTFGNDYTCLGPYDTYDDASYERGEAIKHYDWDGWSLYYPPFGG